MSGRPRRTKFDKVFRKNQVTFISIEVIFYIKTIKPSNLQTSKGAPKKRANSTVSLFPTVILCEFMDPAGVTATWGDEGEGRDTMAKGEPLITTISKLKIGIFACFR
jgi:hypothetical protein